MTMTLDPATNDANHRKERRRNLREKLAKANDYAARLLEIDTAREVAVAEHQATTGEIQAKLADLDTPDDERAKLLADLKAANEKLEVSIDKAKRLGKPLRDAITNEKLHRNVIENDIVRAGDPADLAEEWANRELAKYIGRLDEPFDLLGKFRQSLEAIEDNPLYARDCEVYREKITRFEALTSLLSQVRSDASRRADEIRRHILTQE